MKTLLIISGGIEAVPGIQLAREMGLFVVVSDINQNAPGFKYANDHILVSTYDVKGSVIAAKKYNDNIRKLDGVMCIASDVPHTVASVAAELGLPGISIETAHLAVDKMAMKERFYSSGIPVPKFKALDNINELHSTVKKWGYPLVIKPVDSRGARGVIRLIDGINLNWAWEHALSNSSSKRLMVEKYLSGPQVSTETIMIEGEGYTIGFSDRNYELLEKYSPYIIENGGDLPSNLSEKIQNEVKTIVEKAALSLGITNGIAKGDVVIYEGKPYIIEIAARLSGGYFCTHEIPLNTGVNIVKQAIKQAIGDPINSYDLVQKYNHYICQRYLFLSPGIVQEVSGIEKVKSDNNVKFLDIRIKPGDKIREVTNHPSRVGLVITSGTSRQNAVNNANRAISGLKITMNIT